MIRGHTSIEIQKQNSAYSLNSWQLYETLFVVELYFYLIITMFEKYVLIIIYISIFLFFFSLGPFIFDQLHTKVYKFWSNEASCPSAAIITASSESSILILRDCGFSWYVRAVISRYGNPTRPGYVGVLLCLWRFPPLYSKTKKRIRVCCNRVVENETSPTT